MRQTARFLLPAALFAAMPVAAAEPPLDDPTRPPAGLLGGGNVAGVASGAGLTSVLLPRTGKPWAIIDGERATLGDVVRGGRLTRISETEAVLEGAGGIERLYLTPDVEKKTNMRQAASGRRDKDR